MSPGLVQNGELGLQALSDIRQYIGQSRPFRRSSISHDTPLNERKHP